MSSPTGILLVDKPGGMTSHDVVARVRRALDTRKVGHAGTLDPMATGLLVLGVGSATRLLTYLVGLGKRYTAMIQLGVGTDTDDAEGQVTATMDASAITRAQIDAAIADLTGAIEQVPSSFSAIKVDGRRSYDRARAGEEVVLKARPVTIERFAVLTESRDGGVVDLEVDISCSSGTYVRALARDLGAALGVGGHLTVLRREEIGPFGVGDAAALSEDASVNSVAFTAAMRTPAAVAAELFPAARLDAAQAVDLAHGKRVRLDAADAPVVAALTSDERLAGLVAVTGGEARVLVNFPTDEVLG